MSVSAVKKENILYLLVRGRVDSANAEEVEKELNACRAAETYSALVLDLDGLEYISSAGLRVVLRLRKAEETLKVINASGEVYEIFDMTGFTEMLPVEKAYRRLCVDGCEVIGRGAKGTVYRYNSDTIVKVYHNPDSLPDIQRERELARRAFVLGIPTAISYDIVKVGESFGSVFELLDAKSFSQLIAAEPERIDEYVGIFADMLRQIHRTEVRPDDMPCVKLTVRKWLDAVKPFIPAAQSEKLEALVAATPDPLRMLHCDYHTNNVMMQNGEALLIDMDTLAYGHPVFELANVHITYVGFGVVDPTVVDKFIGFPYDTAVTVWKKFLPRYLCSDDQAYIDSVEQKVELMSYVRLLRHVSRRGIETDAARRTVELCTEKINTLINVVDTLEF